MCFFCGRLRNFLRLLFVCRYVRCRRTKVRRSFFCVFCVLHVFANIAEALAVMSLMCKKSCFSSFWAGGDCCLVCTCFGRVILALLQQLCLSVCLSLCVTEHFWILIWANLAYVVHRQRVIEIICPKSSILTVLSK